MCKNIFVTGTDTGVGKTIVSALLADKLKYAYYKPIQCGLNVNGLKDSEVVKSIFEDVKVIKESYFFRDPVSPNIASKNFGIKIEFSKFLEIKNSVDNKIIEGAGGLNVPINNEKLISDLISFFRSSTVLVCRTKLGTINHTLMSIEVMKNKGINLAGLMFCGDENIQTVETIKTFGKKIYGKKIKVLGRVPFAKKIDKNFLRGIKLREI